MSFRIISITMIIGFLFGCGGESQKKDEKEMSEISLADECVSSKAGSFKSTPMENIDFGDGSDGELYLAYDDVFLLEEKEYNFTNVNLDQGSLLMMVGELSEGEGIIQINSLGVCNLLGDVDISNYRGTFILNCSSIILEGSYNHSSGNTVLTTPDSILISDETSTNISESTMSTGSIDISSAELSTVSVNALEGVVTYFPEAIVINDNSSIITAGEISFEIETESDDVSLTNCSS